MRKRDHHTLRCDCCGRGNRHTTRLYAYRSSYSTYGPWIAERFCEECKRTFSEVEWWTIRPLYRMAQMDLPAFRMGPTL